MGTTGTGQRVPQHLLTPVQADQLIILNRQIGDQHRLGKTGSLHGSHPASGGGLLLPGQFAPDIRFPLKAQAQAETQRQIEDAKRQIRLEQDAAIRAARSEIALLAVDIAQKVIREKLDNTPAQMNMIDRLLDEAPVMKGDTKIQ